MSNMYKTGTIIRPLIMQTASSSNSEQMPGMLAFLTEK